MIVSTPIKVELSTHHIIFTPRDDGTSFPGSKDSHQGARANVSPDMAVIVTNRSQVFASFQVTLHVEGQTPNEIGEWYRVEPNVGAKKPPGDRTTFYINLTKEPLPAYGTTIPAKLTVSSPELSDVNISHPLYIQILRPSKTLRVYLPLQDLQVTPGNRLRIPVLVYNLNPTPRHVHIRLQGLALDWFPEAFKKSLWIESGGFAETEFWCAPAPVSRNRHQVYPFTIEATDDEGNSASLGSKLEILPFGHTEVSVLMADQILPGTAAGRSLARQQTVHYPFRIENVSNVKQTIRLQTTLLKSTDKILFNDVEIDPGETLDHSLSLKTHRPVLGWPQIRQFEVWPQLTYADSAEAVANINVQPSSQRLTLKIHPVLPWWLQLLLLLLGCLGLGWLWLLSPRPLHKEPVNSVVLMSNGDTVVSGSRDQTLRRWRVFHSPWLPNVRRLVFRTKIETEQHPFRSAIRVIEPLPAGNKQIAVGLENGGIQLWKVDPPEYQPSFLDDVTVRDKVFDLAFSQNSQYLFSGHGSGQVRQWDMENQQASGKPLYLATPVSSLDVIDRMTGEIWVAIATQFNRLVLWDWQGDRAYDIRYTRKKSEYTPTIDPVISSNSYLISLDVADDGTHMVTSDSVGFITLWDINTLIQCAQTSTQRSPLANEPKQNGHDLFVTDCEDAIRSQWPQNTGGHAVRDVAITANGCYVASTGDNGDIDLWTIDRNNQPQSHKLAQIPQHSLNTVDIHLTTNDGEQPNKRDIVLVAADTANHRIQLYRNVLPPDRCQ